MPGRVAGGDACHRRVAAVLAVGQRERRLESRQSLDRRVAARAFVDVDHRLAALGVADRDRRHLGVEAAGIDRGDRLLVARQRERVLVLAAHGVADRDALGVRAHVAVLDRAPQAVVHGRVDELAVAEAVAEAAPWRNRYGAWFIDSMPPATTSSASPGADLGGGQHDRLEPRAADAIDRRGRRAVRQTGLERRLAGRCLADARLEDLAHQDFVDGGRRGSRPGPLNGRADRDAAEVRRGNRAQRSAELADRGARGADEIDVAVRPGIVRNHWPNLHLDPVRPPRASRGGRRARRAAVSFRGARAGRCRSRGRSSGRGGRRRPALRARAAAAM